MFHQLCRRRALMSRVAAALICALLALILPPPAGAQEPPKGTSVATKGVAVAATASQAPESAALQSRAPGEGAEGRTLPSREAWAPHTVSLPAVQQNPPIELPPDYLWGPIALIVGVIAAALLLVTFVGHKVQQANLRDRGMSDALAADPPEVTFGVQPRDAPAARRVVIISRSAREIVVSAVAISGRGFEIVSAPALPLALAPGGQMAFDVTFQSSDPGRRSGKLSVRSNVPGGNLTVRLQARVQ